MPVKYFNHSIKGHTRIWIISATSMGNKDVKWAPLLEHNVLTLARIWQPSWQLITRDSTRPSAGYCTRVIQPRALLQAWAEIAGKLPGGKRPGDAGWQVLLIRLVLQTLPQLQCPSLDMLHHLKVFPEMPLVLVLTPCLASQQAIVNCLILFPPFPWMFLIGWHLEFNKELFSLYCLTQITKHCTVFLQ